jgi:hypothetical protein
MVVDDNNTRDWVADCNGEGGERAARAGGERWQKQRSGDDGCSGGRWRWWMMTTKVSTIAVEDNGMQDQVVDYDGEGQERAAKEGRDSGVVMMAVAVENGCGGQQWWQRMTTAADNEGSR